MMALQIGLGLLLGVIFIILLVLFGFGIYSIIIWKHKKKDLFHKEYDIKEWYRKDKE